MKIFGFGIFGTLAFGAVVTFMSMSCSNQREDESGLLYRCDAYSLYADSVVEAGGIKAVAESPYCIVSTYKAEAPERPDNEIEFNFYINGNRPEFSDSTIKHRVRLVPSSQSDTTVYQYHHVTRDENLIRYDTPLTGLDYDVEYTFRVDMRRVLRAFTADGYYVVAAGDTLFREDFSGVWLRGSDTAICADDESPGAMRSLKMTDRGDSVYVLTVSLNPSPRLRENPRRWSIDSIPASYPKVSTGMKLLDALYNMAVATMAAADTPVYSPRDIVLSQAFLDPAGSMASLRSKVSRGRIVESVGEDGAQGSWPICNNRIEWILAAWELYKVTGDADWAREAFDVARLSLADDQMVNYRGHHGLFCGSPVAPEYRTAYFPEWMSMVDLYGSMSLVSNVMYARAYDILNSFADILGEDAGRYESIATNLREAVNLNFWIPHLGYYSEYLYGVYPLQSHVADNLGQALCILFDIATPEMATRLSEKTISTGYGVTALFPYTGTESDRYNRCVRADYQAFWILAMMHTHDYPRMESALMAQWRNAAIMAGEAPYINAVDGGELFYGGDEADRVMSASARLSSIYRVVAGMEFTPTGIEFHPVVPVAINAAKMVTGFKYRDSDLDILIRGTGSTVARFAIDGRESKDHIFPASLSGKHNVEITLANNDLKATTERDKMQKIPTIPPIPDVTLLPDGRAKIKGFTKEYLYDVYLNGIFEERIEKADYSLYNPHEFAAVAINANSYAGQSGYTTRQFLWYPPDKVITLYPDSVGDVTLTATINSHLDIPVEVEDGGAYLLEVNYSNGAAPLSNQRSCAIRTLLVNGTRSGVFVMPQMGAGRWGDSGFSNIVDIRLEKGFNNLSIDYVVPSNINVADDESRVVVHYVRLIKLE